MLKAETWEMLVNTVTLLSTSMQGQLTLFYIRSPFTPQIICIIKEIIAKSIDLDSQLLNVGHFDCRFESLNYTKIQNSGNVRSNKSD